MTKEEEERASAPNAARTSSVPPRPASNRPPGIRTPLPSIPPSTDAIDTDWGGEPSPKAPAAEPEPVAAKPASLAPMAAPPRASTPPAAPRASSPPTATMTPRPNQTSPLRKQTLLGIAPVVAPKSEPPKQPPPPREADAVQPILPIAPAEAQIASTVRKNELRSSTLIGISPVREPSEPPPSISAGPPSFASARDVAIAVGENTELVSEPPPPSISAHPPSLASVRDVVHAVENEPAQIDAPPAKSDAPPANSSAPVGPTSRQTPAAAFARQTAPTTSDAPSKEAERASAVREAEPAKKRSGMSIALLAAAGLVLGILGYRALHREGPPPDLAALPAASTLPTPAAASPSAQPALEPANAAPEPAPSASAADFHAAPPAPLDSPTDAKPVASADPAAAASALPAGVTRVTITSSPPKAKFFHYGKEVGTAPFVVDLQPGEKHAYEVWLPGHVTRKVFVDGTKTELKVGLKEDK